jgi:hypothetical protein
MIAIKNTNEWRLLKEFVRTSSQWVSLIGEQWLCDKGKVLEYWRVEKVDSVIVLPVHRGVLLTAKSTFRPGVRRETLDFPGGRLPDGKSPVDIVPMLLERELGVSPADILNIRPLNSEKWDINSSFSNQGLWAFVANIASSWEPVESLIGLQASTDDTGINLMLEKLDCLQCRAVLLEWARLRDTTGSQ